jgi:hypothetical protein
MLPSRPPMFSKVDRQKAKPAGIIKVSLRVPQQGGFYRIKIGASWVGSTSSQFSVRESHHEAYPPHTFEHLFNEGHQACLPF